MSSDYGCKWKPVLTTNMVRIYSPTGVDIIVLPMDYCIIKTWKAPLGVCYIILKIKFIYSPTGSLPHSTHFTKLDILKEC